eukprot:TRINITY_DN13233_c0_g1_i2.p1 TRINITY_DN13233_c0_g1~~TRINITY_DN13233_c0_g1_i2.p1  ORF type:complete len:763 (+),score=129.91 TRINITY_DN13233_c0_g1_i2:23-2290(+)
MWRNIARVLAMPALATAALLGIQIDPNSGNYSVQIQGISWFPSGETRVQSGWKTYSSADGSLRLKSVGHPESGSDRLGSFNRTEVIWDAGGQPFVTAFRLYDGDEKSGTLVFEQNFPTGLEGCGSANKNDILSTFPSLRATHVPSPSPLGYLCWRGAMVGDAVGGSWDQSTTGLPGGLEDSGPTVVFTKDFTTEVVISPLSNPMATSRYFDPNNHALQYGIMATVQSIPKGYRQETILSASSDISNGIKRAMRRWGDSLLTYYNKERKGALERDPTLTSLGYSTDNGAYYYYVTEPNKNYEDTLVDVKAYSQAKGIPYKYILLDSWWYYKGIGDGVKNWTAMPDIFPSNLTGLFEKTDWPVQGHNRYWAPDTTYAKHNGGTFDFIVEKNFSIPTQQEFWDFLIGDSKKWGLVVYEQDWLFNEFEGLNATLSSATLAGQWLTQMGVAADKVGIAIQYCMSWGRHILHSVSLPAVTNARASGDYSQGRSQQWRIGISSVFADAVGLLPSKDNYWSKSEQPGNRYNSNEPFPALQSAVSSLSAGPVAPSDMIGGSDPELIMRACTAGGKLLRPDRPATALDGQLQHLAFPDTGISGDLWHTWTDVSAGRWHHVIAPVLPTAVTLRPSDLDRNFSHWQQFSKWVSYPNSNTSAENVKEFSDSSPLNLDACTPGSFHLYHIAPVYPTGWAVLGETDKWVRMSAARVLYIALFPQAFNIELQGSLGETFSFEFLSPQNKVGTFHASPQPPSVMGPLRGSGD